MAKAERHFENPYDGPQLAERFITSTLDEPTARLREERYQKMFQDIIDSGALTPESQAQLAAQLDPKALANVDALAETIHQLDDFAEMMGKDIERRVRAQGTLRKISHGLKSGILTQMTLWTIRKINGARGYFLAKKNPDSLEVENEALIPQEYFNFEPKLDKERVKEAIGAGKEVPGCRIVSNKFHLEVK